MLTKRIVPGNIASNLNFIDPDKNLFDQVIEAAQVTNGLLDDMGITSYCKKSRSTGLHIYIPLGHKYTYDQSKEFARAIVTMVHSEEGNCSYLVSKNMAVKCRRYLFVKVYQKLQQKRMVQASACAIRN